MELRIAVCDDAEEDRTYVSGLVKDWAAQAGHQAEITAFSSAESFLFRYAEDKNWDILLLDIEMGAMDGAQSGTQHPGDDPIPKHIWPAEQRQLLQNLGGEEHRHIGQNCAHDGIQRRRREKSAADSVQCLCRTEMNGQSVPETHFLFHNQNAFPS